MWKESKSFGVLVMVSGALAGMAWADTPQVRSYKEGLRITRAYGPGLAVGTAPKVSAERFRVRHAAMFGVDPNDLKPRGLRGDGVFTQPVMYDRKTRMYKFTLATYRQYKGEIPVFRSDLRLLVRNEPGFPIVLAASSLRNLGDFAPGAAPVLLDPATQVATNMDRFTEPEVVIWAGVNNKVPKPVVAVTFVGEKGSPQGGEYEKWLFVVDAVTGEILYRENRIILTDVSGNVSGMATEGPKPDFCAAEVSTPMPWATAYILGGNSTYTDENGDFTIPNPGTSEVTVRSPMYGDYFVVMDAAGPEELLSQVVTPPGPADFMHNAANESESIEALVPEYVRAQVNAYVQANVVRDFALTYNPDYPVISTQKDFPVRVNRADMYCPGNAWYDGSAINFCVAGLGYPNTAFSGIVHHEYGHHLVENAGSGQGQYGEGISDSIGVLIADDPVQGYGWYGNCNSGLRTADNNYQYPCTGEIHECGQLMSGCVWSTRNELEATNPDTYLDILSNLTINSILLHTGTLITPQITIDFLTLDDDDGNIGNGTPHRDEICAGFGDHSMDCPPLDPRLSVTPTAGFESAGPEGGPFSPDSMIYILENRSDSPIDYLVTTSVPWLSLSDESGTLAPLATTPVTVSFSAEAETLVAGRHTGQVSFVNTTDHVGDTTRDVVLMVGEPTVIYEWPLDSDPGWMAGLSWAWGQPTGGGGQYGGPDPTSGYTGTNVYGYNLDGDYENNILLGAWLTTTPIDCTNLWNVTLRFWRWLGVAHPTYDHASVEISLDGFLGTTIWQNYEEITDYAWVQQEFDISAFADNQPTVYLRWVMGPTDKSRQYCGWNIDDVQILAIAGAPTCSDGILNQGEDRIDCGGPCPPCDCTDDLACDDGLFCNGAETCDAYGHCQGGTDPCPGEDCDEVNDVCVPFTCDDDGTCEASENCDSCPNDCISGGPGCGNGVCEWGSPENEDCHNCASDCNGKLTGKPDNQFCCGDDVFCDDSRCTSEGFGCSEIPIPPYCCGDGTCEGLEDQCNCAIDCGDPPASEIPYTTCRDGEDNDCDGDVDCDDTDCDDEDPICICGQSGDPCTTDADCCSGDCKKNGTCR